MVSFSSEKGRKARDWSKETEDFLQRRAERGGKGNRERGRNFILLKHYRHFSCSLFVWYSHFSDSFVDQDFKNNSSNGCFCNKSNKTLMCKKENINSLKMGEEATIRRIAEIGHCSFHFPLLSFNWGLIGHRNREFYPVECCIFLYSHKYSWALLFDGVKLLGNVTGPGTPSRAWEPALV